MDALIAWWCTVTPKAKWLIVWSCVYTVASIILFLTTGSLDLLILIQIPWILISALPLVNRRLAVWLQMRPKVLDWFKIKLK